MGISIAVLIATAGRAALLDRTLSSLSECSKPASLRQVIVIENGPKGSAEAIVALHHSGLPLRYEYVARANKSDALNQAVELLSGSLVYFTDDDVRFHPDTLQAYAGTAKGIAGKQCYGGPMEIDYDVPPPDWLLKYLPPSAVGWRPEGTVDCDSPSLFFPGCNWAAFADDVRDIGGFDPNFGPGSPVGSRGQERNMQKRLAENGVRKVYVPQAVVWHYVPPERCSPRWALYRAYQSNVAYSSRQRHDGPRFLGYPRWMFRELAKTTIAFVVSSMSADPRARYVGAHRLLSHLGCIAGSKLASRDPRHGSLERRKMP